MALSQMHAQERTAFERVRDYLAANGPADPAVVARACDLSVGQISQMMSNGAVRSAHGTTPGRNGSRCAICKSPARVTDLCDDCRGRFVAHMQRTLAPVVRTAAAVAARAGSPARMAHRASRRRRRGSGGRVLHPVEL